MKMSKSGDKIDYSLRIQKSIERKIFGDVIRTLYYFGPIEDYRYIGFGSFYFKDFLMFHEDFSIHKGVSIEIDSDAYLKKSKFIESIQVVFATIIDCELEKISLDLEKLIVSEGILCNEDDFDGILKINVQNIVAEFLKVIGAYENDLVPKMKLKGNEENWFREISGVHNQLSWILFGELFMRLKEALGEKIQIREDGSSIEKAQLGKMLLQPENYLVIEKTIVQRELQKHINNRFIFNKPYGFISLTFGELSSAIESIEWDDNQRNIIWLDYDEFIDETQLLGLEKCIMKSSRGDLILFSTSLGSNAEDRFESLKNLKNNTDRVVGNIRKADCDNKFIYMPIRKLVKNTVKAALSKKNARRAEGTPIYAISEVIECTYTDGMPMYTFGIIVHYRKDKGGDKQFPTDILKNNKWYPKEDACYSIYVPALTHKEMNAINSMLPNHNTEEIHEAFPFIPKASLKRYVEIWNYYPNFFEVGRFV